MIDWGALKSEYITGSMSYKGLADSHAMHYTTIQRVATAERWPDLRAAYRAEAVNQAIAGEMVNEVDRLKKLMDAANAIQDVIINAVDDPEQFRRHLVPMERYDGDLGAALKDTEERVYSKFDTKAIKDLTGAIKDLTYSMRNLYGLPTQAEREAQRIAAERLEIERRKAQQGDENDKEITVVLKGLEDYSR